MSKLKDYEIEWEHTTVDYEAIRAKNERDALRRFKKKFLVTSADDVKINEVGSRLVKRLRR